MSQSDPNPDLSLASATRLDLMGAVILKGALPPEAQAKLVEQVRACARAAPPVRFETPSGRRMSVVMTSAGRLGWTASRRGYAYAPAAPSGAPWPPIPPAALSVWRAVSGWTGDPDCCLINWYGEDARMGLHQDKDEDAYDAPVVSISLGDPGLFRVGGVEAPRPTRSVWLDSGDVAILGGAARLAWHGVDRIRFGASSLLPKGGRLNLTLRVVRSA
ncbi:MAG: alpha-ketoglutarate-dependent dioxygenase AlkB [Pseudomonadota bacterium]